MYQKIAHFINTFLAPVERAITRYQKYIRYFLLLLSGMTIFLLGNRDLEQFTGEQALNILWIILWIPIVAKVLGIKVAQALTPLRKELGILMGMLALIHGIIYFLPVSVLGLKLSTLLWSDFWIYHGMITATAVGVVTLILTLPLLLTSNKFSINVLGKNWKHLHRIVYIVVIFTLVHKVLYGFESSGTVDYAEFASLALYFTGKILEWKGISFTKKTYPKGQKWLCPPCGYIYDPAVGDTDSGIAPGTEFTDIPDGWRCPVCGVAKSDFIPLTDDAPANIEAKIEKLEYQNPTTIELTIATPVVLESQAGQFVTFAWHDEQGEFTRSYSIAVANGNSFTFLIKLGELGRGATLLRKLAVGDSVAIRGVFGHFVLENTNKPKVFIATGTGLAPIYNMILSLRQSVIPGLTRNPEGNKDSSGKAGFLPSQEGQKPSNKIRLYFTVSTAAELFYVEKLKSIPELELHIHTTKEGVVGCNCGRVNIDEIAAENGTEWYLCGNPRMVTEAKEKLASRGFASVYSEEF